jgi:hypothetical protein
MWGEGDSGRGTVSREGKGEWMWTMYVLQMYEYGTLKPWNHFMKGNEEEGRNW